MEIDVVVLRLGETEKAVEVTDGEVRRWVPKALTITEGWDFNLVQISYKLAKQKGLFTPPDWEPVASTREATLYVLRTYSHASKRMKEWLKDHELQLAVWLQRQMKLYGAAE